MADVVDIIRRIYEGFDVGDLAPLLASLDPDVEWNEAAHVTFWRTWSVHVDRLLACGETVIMKGRYSGTARADTWLFAEATGVVSFTR